MAKIGTAHVEIKPVLNEEALAEIARQIEEAVRAAVQRAMPTPMVPNTLPMPTCGSCGARYLGYHACTVS